MAFRVESVDVNGRRKWVADFAQGPTARDFVTAFNRRYAGHLTATITEGK